MVYVAVVLAVLASVVQRHVYDVLHLTIMPVPVGRCEDDYLIGSGTCRIVLGRTVEVKHLRCGIEVLRLGSLSLEYFIGCGWRWSVLRRGRLLGLGRGLLRNRGRAWLLRHSSGTLCSNGRRLFSCRNTGRGGRITACLLILLILRIFILRLVICDFRVAAFPPTRHPVLPF